MVGWGWLDRPARRLADPDQALTSVEQFFRSQRELAETIGEWTFYAALILMTLALIKYFPYRLFRKTHKWLAVLYVALAYHSFILIKTDYWAQPIGWLMGLMILGGFISAGLILTNRVGQKRKVQGEVISMTHHTGVSAVEGVIQLQTGWAGHQPGQFAFVTSNSSEGPHPYTIASAWEPSASTLTFVVKELGDWTKKIVETIKPGTPVTVEGPYGHFTFDDDCEHQIWVGAGIGITPFIAKMKQLAKASSPKQVDLFHLTSDDAPEVMALLIQDAEDAGITLHLHNSRRDGRLTPEVVQQVVDDWKKTSVWYCGPNELGKVLRERFTSQGLAQKHFHQELFQMR